MSQAAGRIVCPRCGSNNFDTVSACWKCSAPIGAGSPAAFTPPSAAPMPSRSATAGMAAPTVNYPSPALPVGAAVPAQDFRAAAGDPARANRAAFWLGVLFPYFGYPIGLAFMMCDDRRRQEVGRICILWSTISGVVHLLLMFVTIVGMRQYVGLLLGGVRAGLNNRGSGSSLEGLDFLHLF